MITAPQRLTTLDPATPKALAEFKGGHLLLTDRITLSYEASRDYDPEPLLGRIRARVLAINSADDERNPHETGLMAAAIARIPNARLLLIPGSTETAGHGTAGQARFWREELAAFLQRLP